MSTTDPMQAFVEQELESFAGYLAQQAKERIMRMGLRVDDDLLSSMATRTATRELQLWFKDHGRMQDMGAGRGYHKGKYMGPAEREHLLKGRRPRRWYSPLAYGSVYGTLANNLANKYVQEVPAMIKEAVVGKGQASL